nr:16S rRNA (cytosine(1402)-N(4))-methyltransferase RsmH [Amylibacter marinus]
MAQIIAPSAPHIPVLLAPILENAAPISGRWLDGTFGAGGYTRALLDAGASDVYAIDRDPEVFVRAEKWAGEYENHLHLIHGTFGRLDELARDAGAALLDGVVLDIGVSSMQIDQAARGFSFMKDGPLDMRMAQAGMSAADIVNSADEGDLADLIYLYGEDRASRRIARNIVKARALAPIETTFQLVEVLENSLPRAKPNQAHVATRTFQALRIAVNDELGQLVAGLRAAEAVLAPGGVLAVVTFHSIEDRIVKRFLQARSGNLPKGNRYQPEVTHDAPRFQLMGRKAIGPSKDELDHNPRARSAKLRMARRLDTPAGDFDTSKIGLPKFDLGRIS